MKFSSLIVSLASACIITGCTHQNGTDDNLESADNQTAIEIVVASPEVEEGVTTSNNETGDKPAEDNTVVSKTESAAPIVSSTEADNKETAATKDPVPVTEVEQAQISVK